MRQVVLIGSISVCILLVVLLFKLNKTKIEYDNKLVALNRKVRDLTNLIDLSNTKQNLIKESTGEVVGESVSCLLYTSPSPRDAHESRMPSSA